MTDDLLKRRYLNEGETCWEDICERVASTLCEADEDERYYKDYYEVLKRKEVLPNSPTLMSAGTDLQYMSACLVLEPQDSMRSIAETSTEVKMVTKYGAGVGLILSNLRPKGDIVHTTGGEASGPISFMENWNMDIETVKQGGRRKGALMGVLNVHHPDILDFIKCKGAPSRLHQEILEALPEDVAKEAVEDALLEHQLRNFNISVGITREFMDALEDESNYRLLNPRNDEVVGWKSATEVWDTIVKYAHKNGEPGIVFLDKINEDHPLNEEIKGVNVCVSGDCWVMTPSGARQVKWIKDETNIELALNGKYYETRRGFVKTGKKAVFKVTTNCGVELKATRDHKIKTVNGWKEVQELNSEDEVILGNNRGLSWNSEFGNLEQGYILGAFVGDGWFGSDERGVLSIWDKDEGSEGVEKELYRCVTQELETSSSFHKVSGKSHKRLCSAKIAKLAKSYCISRENKHELRIIEGASKEFYIGFLRGLFDTDGYVWRNDTRKAIKIWQNNLEFLKGIQRMLLHLGIKASLYKDRKPVQKKLLPDGKGGEKLYSTTSGHELSIGRDNFHRFVQLIGSCNYKKLEAMTTAIKDQKRRPYKESFTSKVESVEEIGVEPVYDATVPEASAFSCNGIIVHNCGEQPLLAYEQCNLGAVNLAKMLRDGSIDWEKLRETVFIAVRMLDNTIDLNDYPIPEIEEKSKQNRKIGVGVMGWGELLMRLGISYDSEEAFALAKTVSKELNETAIEASEVLAESRGPFPNFENSDIETPRRNAVLTTVAPTGSRSMIAGTTGGIEPVFSVEPMTHTDMDDNVTEFAYDFIEEAPDIARVGALDIDPKDHVRMQAAWQKHIGSSISKTVNMPYEATEEDVKEVYELAYELGCKGITIYRTGSRNKQVLNVKNEGGGDPEVKIQPPQVEADSKRFKLNTGCGTMYLIVVFNSEGRIVELFTETKNGGCRASTEALSRLNSLALRGGIPLEKVIDQLMSVSPCVSYQVAKHTRDDVSPGTSCPHAIGLKLRELVKGEVEVDSIPQYEECPECGSPLQESSGCNVCRQCGWSQCG